MSSDREELMDEGPAKSDAEKSDSPSPKKTAKPKRRGRRGKKRKQRKESGDSSHYSEEQEGSRAAEPESWDSNEEAESANDNYSGQMLRPNAPHAPKNSTQFIIDDHNECRLYMSFETPNPYLTTSAPANDGSMIMEPIGEDAAYVDVDYQYESPQDFDNSAYYDREFELSYKSNRFEELLRLPRERLVSGLRQLEQRLKELSDDLVKENPTPILEKLQHHLLELQEKHCELQEANTRLTALVAQREDGRTDENCEERPSENDSIVGEELQNSDDLMGGGTSRLSDEAGELRKECPSDDTCSSSPTLDERFGAEAQKQSLVDDSGRDHCESSASVGDKQSKVAMEVEKSKDCLEGQLSKFALSEQSDCDATMSLDQQPE